MVEEKVEIAIGTDSLASNDKLSVLRELVTLLDNFVDLDFETVLKWGTLNGARALNLDSLLGSIEVGKKPGLVLLENFDFERMRPTQETTVKLFN